MLIELAGQVVVLDEAHNMEDSAREAASQTVTSSQLEEVTAELREICEDVCVCVCVCVCVTGSEFSLFPVQWMSILESFDHHLSSLQQ